MSKGSSPRPIKVPKDEYDKRWEAIFGKKKPPEPKKEPKPLEYSGISKCGFWYWSIPSIYKE